ncbi:MAG: hypothetical protein H7Y33_03850 [Cytophagales bacterium]|nr:hypothetical protein [Rhizobacter sp.]
MTRPSLFSLCVAIMLVGGGGGGGARAQITALPSTQEPPLSVWATPQGVARTFQQGCVLTGGDEAAAVDWALAQGFEPAEALRGNVDGLLSGQPGSVLAAPGTRGRVLLAAAQGRQCTVWADQMPGPALRSAVAEALSTLTAKGARLQLQVDRNFERAGAWRNQMQWRYRAVGTTLDLGLGAITTLSDNPGTQALNLAPLPATPAFAPDGLPTR